MKIVKVITICFIILLTSVCCYAINLDSTNLVDNIISSLSNEKDHWIIRESSFYYINKKISTKDRHERFPDYIDGCIVYISFSIFRDDGYIIIKKPTEIFIKGKDFEKMKKTLYQILYEELHNRYGIRMPQKKIVIKEQPIIKTNNKL